MPTLRAAAAQNGPGHGARSGDSKDEYIVPVAYGIDYEHNAHILESSKVRRLTPVECERLQGFPDNYTNIIIRGKPAADGPRYKALGNSMAVPCMGWIGRRIAAIEELSISQVAA